MHTQKANIYQNVNKYNSIAWMWRPVEGLGLSPASATYFLCKLGHLMNLSVTLLIH